MAKNLLVINCDLRETRVALIEDGIIAELQIERATAKSTVGNVVLGRVTRVLPGMQAAFIDVGMERAAFLHVEDLIRPADFEAYLHGGARDDDDEPSGKGEGGKRHLARMGILDDVEGADDELEEVAPRRPSKPPEARAVSAPSSAVEPEPDLEDDDDDDDDHAEAGETDSDLEGGTEELLPVTDEPVAARPATELLDEDVEDDDEQLELVERHDDDDDAETSDDDAEASDDDAEAGDDDAEAGDDDAEAGDDDDELAADEDDEDDEELAFTEAESPAEDLRPTPVPAADAAAAKALSGELVNELDSAPDQDSVAAPLPSEAAEETRSPVLRQATAAGEDPRGRRRRRRRRRGGKEEAPPAARKEAPAPRKDAKSAGPSHGKTTGNAKGAGRDKRKLTAPGRVSRSVPITEVVREGDQVIVQISKEPIGTKGARVTSHVSLPGRYVVYLPTVEHIGISKRIGSARERARLRKVIETVKPKTGGLIVRTVAEGLTKKDLKADIGYLIKLWADIARKREHAKAPETLYADLDLVLRTARDLFTDEIEKIVIDDREQYARLCRFVEMFLPSRVKDIELYSGNEPIFDAYGIEDEIGRALSRKVPLPSGGYLIIDQAEALTAIDVNTGRYVGKGSKDLEETALKTNLEAVDEIAYQLRFRNIGGLVILDLIDMDAGGNREKVWRALEHQLAKDKAKTTINRISELGLIEMTRKRTRESLSRTMHEPCFYCDGTGQIQARSTIAYEILRQIRRERDALPGYVVVVNAHPAIVDLMTGEERAAVTEAERRYMRRIEFNARREYHIEQFDLQGK